MFRWRNSLAIRHTERRCSSKIKEKIQKINGKPLAKPPILNRESLDTSNPFSALSEPDSESSNWETLSGTNTDHSSDDINSESSDISDGVSKTSSCDSSLWGELSSKSEDDYRLKPSQLYDVEVGLKYLSEAPPFHISREDKLSVRRNKSFANGKLSLPLVHNGYIVAAHRDSIRYHNMRADFYLWAKHELCLVLNSDFSIKHKEILLLIRNLNYQYLSKKRATRSFCSIRAMVFYCLRQIHT